MAKKMMSLLKADRISPKKLALKKRKSLSKKKLVGRWINCDENTGSLVRVEISTKSGVLMVHAFGACTPTPCDWGKRKAMVYAEGVSSTTAIAFTSTIKFGFKSVIMVGHFCCDTGCLIVETYNHFTDRSGRSDYVSRDCFCRCRQD